MKIVKSMLAVALIGMGSFVMAEDAEHQKVAGAAAYANGQAAVARGQMEVKEVEGATKKGKVARVKASMAQWGFVTYWLGVPTPDGKSKLRFRVYVGEEPTATYAVYIHVDRRHKFIKKLEIPKDAKANTFVNIDLPINVDAEWSGISLKKFENVDKPSLWIDSITVLIPEE